MVRTLQGVGRPGAVLLVKASQTVVLYPETKAILMKIGDITTRISIVVTLNTASVVSDSASASFSALLMMPWQKRASLQFPFNLRLGEYCVCITWTGDHLNCRMSDFSKIIFLV